MAIWHEEYEIYRKYIHNISRFYKQNVQVQAYLELGLSLGATVIFLAFAIRPTLVTMTDKFREMNDKQTIVDQLNAKIDSLSTAQTLLEQEAATLQFLEQSIPTGSNPDDYISQIDALAQVNSVSLESMFMQDTPVVTPAITLDEGVPSSTTGYILWFPFNVTVSGNYESLVNFLNSVENLRRPIKLESAAIEESLEGGLRLTIDGDIPYYNNP